MSDDTAFIPEDQAIDMEVEAPTRPKRGRKPGTKRQPTEPVDVIVSEPQDAPKRAHRATRSKKLTGKHVTEGVVQLGALAAMFTGHTHWVIAPSEVTPWAAETADLLNKIPSRYVDSVLNLSGFFVIGAGMYRTFGPRIAASSALMAQDKRPDAPTATPDAPAGVFTYEPFEGSA